MATNMRSRDQPGVHRIAQTDVDVFGRSQIAHGRESSVEGAFGEPRRVVRLLGGMPERVGEEIGDEVRRELSREMSVRVDETRQQRRIAEVDDFRIGRDGST
jgi:hypothetical protein